MIHRRRFLAFSSAVLIAPETLAKGDDGWTRNFETFIASGLASNNIPGLAIAMVRGGRAVFCRGYGYADVESARRVAADTVFQIASVSKTVTGTALMMLWQDRRFQLDDPIAPHLDFAVVSPKFQDVPITFRHLFTHTSGISDALYDGLDFSTGALPSLRDFLAGYLASGGKWYDAGKTFSGAKPGTAWSYSNVGVALLGHLGEKLGGEPLDAFTRARIFAPLGLHTTSWGYQGVTDARLAEPYEFSNGHFKRLPRTRYPDWPAGLLCTSANDFAKILTIYTQGPPRGAAC